MAGRQGGSNPGKRKKAKTVEAKPVSTMHTLTAYRVYASRGGIECLLMSSFLEHIRAIPLPERWDAPLTKGNQARNFLTLEIESPAVARGHAIFYGRLVEVICRDKLELIFKDGTEMDFDLPAEQGEKSIWEFAMAPEKEVLVMAQRGASCEQKLKRLLEAHLEKWNGKFPAQRMDGVFVEAIPKEEDPVGFLRKNPTLGSFEAVLDARSLGKEDYGFTCGILAGLTDEQQKLKVKIEVSASRGAELPTILVSNLASFLHGIEEDAVYKASVKQVIEGKRARPTKLLNAIESKEIAAFKGSSLRSELVDFTIEMIDDGVADAFQGSQ